MHSLLQCWKFNLYYTLCTLYIINRTSHSNSQLHYFYFPSSSIIPLLLPPTFRLIVKMIMVTSVLHDSGWYASSSCFVLLPPPSSSFFVRRSLALIFRSNEIYLNMFCGSFSNSYFCRNFYTF